METLKEIKFDIDRIILQLFIPGIFVVVPFFLLFVQSFASIKEYFLKSEGITTVALFILSITVGLILEDFGSLIEVKFWDALNKKKYPEIDDEWEAYLKLDLPSNCDLVAQRYLRTILVRMKFELSFSISLILMTIGLIILNLNFPFSNFGLPFYFYGIILPLIIASYVLYESKISSELMLKTRKKIIDKFKK